MEKNKKYWIVVMTPRSKSLMMVGKLMYGVNHYFVAEEWLEGPPPSRTGNRIESPSRSFVLEIIRNLGFIRKEDYEYYNENEILDILYEKEEK